MIHSRAKPHAIAKLIERLESADAALCNAALTNTLTKSGDKWLRGIIHTVRSFADEAKRAAEKKGVQIPPNNPDNDSN